MTKREIQIKLEQDYNDTYGDYIQVTELVKETTGDERQAYQTLRKILKSTLTEMNKELERF